MGLGKQFIALIKPVVERMPSLAAVYRSVRDQLDYMEKPIVTPWGFHLAGNACMARGDHEPLETEFVRRALDEVDLLVNVGANVGYYCCHALSMGKSIIAFEPIDRNLRYLYMNIRMNGWSDAEIYPVALSNSVGIVDMYGGNTGGSLLKGWADIPSSYATLVPSTTMDVVLGRRLQGKRTLILFDVEGAERSMLEGASIALANDPRPLWLGEIVTKGSALPEGESQPAFVRTFQIFLENGYDAFGVSEKIRPVTMDDVDLVSKGQEEFETHTFLFKEAKKRT